MEDEKLLQKYVMNKKPIHNCQLCGWITERGMECPGWESICVLGLVLV